MAEVSFSYYLFYFVFNKCSRHYCPLFSFDNMKQNGIEKKYSSLTNTELDELIACFKTGHLESGLYYMVGFLCRHGYHVQYSHVQHSLHWLDHVGQVLKNWKLRKRCKYHVKQPNALWHIDSHHKLIWWGIVIHGAIDGFCHTVSHSLAAVVLFTAIIQSQVYIPCH